MKTVLVNGVLFGTIYGLLAVGLVLIYRSSRVVNFAYGEMGMLAAFFFKYAWVVLRYPLLLALFLALLVSASVGATMEISIVRTMRRAPPLVSLVATFAVAALLLKIASEVWGTNPDFMPPLVSGSILRLGGLTIQNVQLISIGVAAVLLAGLWLLYRTTSTGVKLRALAIDPLMAGQLGININALSLTVWTGAGIIAGLSAILSASLVSFNVFFMTTLTLRGLAAALVGGLTSIAGAFTAAIALGVAEAVIQYWAPSVAGVVELTLSGMILVLLVVRPTGLVRSAY